jgi:hypothetical protein
MEPQLSATIPERRIYDELVSNGVLWPMEAKGVFGYSAAFEDVIERFNRLIDAIATREGAQQRVFPPILSREVLKRRAISSRFRTCVVRYSIFPETSCSPKQWPRAHRQIRQRASFKR